MTPRSPQLLEALDPAEPVRRLEGERHCDLCIVGGGYLGLWTALLAKAAEPGLDVAVIEAELCGSGASGRNSGMAIPYWTKFEALLAACGQAEALRLCDASTAALDEIESFARAEGLDIELARSGWIWGATSAGQEGRWRPVLQRLAEHGRRPFRELDRAGIEQLVEAPGFRAGAYDPACLTLHPAKLARGLRRVALDRGIAVFEESPMRRLVRGAAPAVETPRGRLRAERVVLAMNAWAIALPELARGILVITSDDAVSEPCPEFLARHRWAGGPILMDSGIFVSGYRPTRDGRIVAGVTGGAIGFGSLRGARFEGRTPREPAILQALAAGFGSTEGLRLATSWRGPIDRTRSGLPLYGRLPGERRIWFGYGFSGNGIVGCRLGGRILASLALERQDDWSACGLVRAPDRWMPPEPARFVGAHMVRWAVRQKDRLDAAGRRQGPIARRLAALAPGGVVTTRS